MADQDFQILTQELVLKLNSSFLLVEASMQGLQAYESDIELNAKQLEPYDALTSRFIRCVEIFIKYFKTHEYFHFANKSDSLRDTLNTMEKNELISNTLIWMRMRDVRNKIVHDYISANKQIFADIMGEFYCELKHSKRQIDKLN
ncbi:MAG: DUF86 domain-containing protein [Methylococcales symbiont of Hymedesmia sp. n. MRB-2018]|nr:MAG: DUF86 domain-containing protein [Methylococcales symbiont of Hymedesmia sp. n. MRB-2018]KAF3983337.1 MAG: DUF86 domain-containing protein [Methylococcales symbiont of Hymedesmia sp. n. MRB-2018]